MYKNSNLLQLPYEDCFQRDPSELARSPPMYRKSHCSSQQYGLMTAVSEAHLFSKKS